MSAKIKQPASRHSGGHSPKGVNRRAYERVYWPFIPVLLLIGLLLPLSIRTGSLASLAHGTRHLVLSYAASENPQVMLADTNAERQANGEPALQLNSELSSAAMAKAKDMATRNYWSHVTPDGQQPWVFVTATGYSYQKLGENLATGFTDEASAINGWMASPPHRENLLDPVFTQVGFGFANAADYKATGGPATIFVAFYGRPSDTIPVTTASSITPSKAPTSGQPISPTLGTSTSKIQTGLAASQLSTWAPVALIIAVLAGLALIVTKHLFAISKAVRRSERFVWHHPIFDLALAIVVILAYSLWQTAGLIQ